MDREAAFTKVVLYTDHDGRAKFREERVALGEGSAAARLSAVLPATGYQLRESPVGFASQFHCTPRPQWVFILQGEMEIFLQDGVEGSGPPPHYHPWDESFYVVSGEIAFGIEDYESVAPAGTLVHLPAGTVLREVDDEREGAWIVLADPEGNEFCVV